MPPRRSNWITELGTIEAGKFGDIVAVDGDPLKDIRILQERKRIQLVIKEGEVYIDRRPGFSREIVHSEPDRWRKIDA